MIGVSKDVSKTFTDDELIAAFDAHTVTLDLRGTYARPNGDSAVLPLRSHLRWIANDRRMTLVAVENPDEAKEKIAVYLSAEAPGVRRRIRTDRRKVKSVEKTREA